MEETRKRELSNQVMQWLEDPANLFKKSIFDVDDPIEAHEIMLQLEVLHKRVKEIFQAKIKSFQTGQLDELKKAPVSTDSSKPKKQKTEKQILAPGNDDGTDKETKMLRKMFLLSGGDETKVLKLGKKELKAYIDQQMKGS